MSKDKVLITHYISVGICIAVMMKLLIDNNETLDYAFDNSLLERLTTFRLVFVEFISWST